MKYYRYVPHHQYKRWEAAGWVYDCDLGPPHAAYSSLYVWPHDSDPVIPDNTDVSIVKIIRNIDNGEQSTDI